MQSKQFIEKLATVMDSQGISPDRGAYTITMREDAGVSAVFSRFLSEAPEQGRLHIGWGSFRNLDIIASRRSSVALIADISVHQLAVWETLASVIEYAQCADDFVTIMAAALIDKPRLRRFNPSVAAWLAADCLRLESWLYQGCPERYQFVRSLFLEKKVCFSIIDLCGDENVTDFSVMGELISQSKFTLDTLYLSNIPYMVSQKHAFYGGLNKPGLLNQLWRNLELLSNAEVWVVSAQFLTAKCRPDNLQWQTELLKFNQAKSRSLASIKR